MLDWRATFEQQRTHAPDDDGAGPLEAGLAADVTALASALEQALDRQPTAEDLAAIRDAWNQAFALTNPGSTIEEWGTLPEVLCSDYVSEILLDEDHEGEFESVVADALAGRFDGGDPGEFGAALAALAVVESF